MRLQPQKRFNTWLYPQVYYLLFIYIYFLRTSVFGNTMLFNMPIDLLKALHSIMEFCYFITRFVQTNYIFLPMSTPSKEIEIFNLLQELMQLKPSSQAESNSKIIYHDVS